MGLIFLYCIITPGHQRQNAEHPKDSLRPRVYFPYFALPSYREGKRETIEP